jgi:ABC-type lipoprotein export system ATPase subunit
MIQFRNISKTYERPDRARLEVLKDVDGSIEEGAFAAVVGPSGSGKSTLMNILGLLDQPDSGTYRLNGREVTDLDPTERARIRNQDIGFVFQQFHLLPRTSAVENVTLPLVYSDVPDPEDRAVAALARVGLSDRLHHHPHELSGGQQQRVAIARALVNDPRLILADEPTGNLDAEATEEIMEIFLGLHRAGRTIVLITHDPDLAARCTERLRIEDGRLFEEAMV